MAKFKKGDIVSLKGSKALHVIEVVSVSKRPKEKAVTVYHISGTPKHRMYISDDLVKVK
jgi:uncharacterized protein YijF (DUF1287 family)